MADEVGDDVEVLVAVNVEVGDDSAPAGLDAEVDLDACCLGRLLTILAIARRSINPPLGVVKTRLISSPS